MIAAAPTRPLAATAATIRPVTPADAAAVREVIAAAYAQYEDVLSADLYCAYLADLLDVEGRSDDAITLVAEVDGVVVGTVCLYPDASAAAGGWPSGWSAIRALAVDPVHRGHGTARRLVEECIERATVAGARVMGLHTASLMTAAVHLYEQLGFVREPAHDMRADRIMGVADADAPLVIAYRLDLAHPLDTYALGRSEAETRRLVLQHQIYAPITRQIFAAAGITRGMKVLDLGSGAGDVALTLADLVGPEGRVVGVDVNPAILETARSRIDAAGWSNVELLCGDIRQLDLAADFDAVVGRWILMYLDDPADVLRQAQRHLRPGGTVAFIESADLRAPVRAHPPTPVHELVVRWTTPPAGAPGPTFDMGLRLHQTFLDAGLRQPQLRMDAPIGGGPAWQGYRFVAESVRSLLPFLEQVGAVTAAEADVDTLADRLRAEVVASGGVQILPAVVGAWARAD